MWGVAFFLQAKSCHGLSWSLDLRSCLELVLALAIPLWDAQIMSLIKKWHVFLVFIHALCEEVWAAELVWFWSSREVITNGNLLQNRRTKYSGVAVWNCGCLAQVFSTHFRDWLALVCVLSVNILSRGYFQNWRWISLRIKWGLAGEIYRQSCKYPRVFRHI